MSERGSSLWQLNLATLLWGGTAMFAKALPLSVFSIICLRSAVAALALFVFARCVGARLRLAKASDYGRMAALAVALGAHWLIYFQALKVSTAAVAILALHTYPVLTALLEPWLFGEKYRRGDIMLAALVFAGVFVMLPHDGFGGAGLGIALGVLSGVFFMARNLLTRRWVSAYGSSTLMFWQTAFVASLLFPTLFFLDDHEHYDAGCIPTFLVLGTLFTALPQLLFSNSMKRLSAKTASVLATLLPFYGAVLGYFIHGETVSWREVLGGGLILLGIVAETVRSARAP
ncbi:MAG: EamA family transporter, partial [Planctomycetes bacterium]|nr:EamA family transporter [Planctomycetota bacterium]